MAGRQERDVGVRKGGIGGGVEGETQGAPRGALPDRGARRRLGLCGRDTIHAVLVSWMLPDRISSPMIISAAFFVLTVVAP